MPFFVVALICEGCIVIAYAEEILMIFQSVFWIFWSICRPTCIYMLTMVFSSNNFSFEVG